MTATKSKSILMIAGEASGDLHGASVVRELLKSDPDLQIFGIGGERMNAAGQEQFYTTKEMAIIGFTEVVRHLPFILSVMKRLENEVRERQPACAILIDYPGFNLRFAKRLKKMAIPILYYIAPQVWAWGARRIPKMARLIDHLAVVFAFEKDIFASQGLPTTFVGHPLLEVLHTDMTREVFLKQQKLPEDAKVLGLLPGSRVKEVEKLLPDMLATAKQLVSEMPGLRAIVAKAADVPQKIYSEIFEKLDTCNVLLLENATYLIMAHSDGCLVASGTATLETGCFGTPLVVVYRTSKLTYQIARRLVKLKNIGLVNIVAGEPVAQELIQDDFTPDKAATALFPLLTDEQQCEQIKTKLKGVRNKLGKPGASKRVAELTLNFL
ncbi:MAG: lipid-A-disaccharide synthase [bacterium]